MPIRDIHDVEAMARLNADARQALEVPERIADALIVSYWRQAVMQRPLKLLLHPWLSRRVWLLTVT
jgi:hypothetical protein